MSNAASTITIIAALLAVFGGWSYWLKAYLDTRFTGIDQRLDRVGDRVDGLDATLRDHDRRITRLEERTR